MKIRKLFDRVSMLLENKHVKSALLVLLVLCTIQILLSLTTKTVYLPLRIQVTSYSESHSEGTPTNLLIYKYDDENRLIELSYNNGHSSPDIAVTTDEQGRVLSYKAGLWVSDDVISSISETNTYDEQGRLLTSEDADTKIQNVYDENGLLIRKDKTKHYFYQTEYSYNEQNQLVKAEEYKLANKQHMLFSVTDYEYDKLGRLSREIRTNLEDNFTLDVTYAYKGNQTIAHIARTNSNGSDTITCIYDHQGNLIKQQYSGDLAYIYRYTYKEVRVPIWKDLPVYRWFKWLTPRGITAGFDYNT